MKIEQLVTNLTSVGSPARAERGFLGDFWRYLAKSGHFCERGATL